MSEGKWRRIFSGKSLYFISIRGQEFSQIFYLVRGYFLKLEASKQALGLLCLAQLKSNYRPISQ